MNQQVGNSLPYNCLMMTRTYLILFSFLAAVPTLVACQGEEGATPDPTPTVAPPFPTSAEAQVADARASSIEKKNVVVAQPASAPPQAAPGAARSSYEGTAQNAKMGAVLIGEDGVRHWVALDAWPDAVVGKKIQLDAVPVVRYDLPVATVGPNGEQSAGVVVEPGQTAEDAARRVVLTDPVWKLSE